jgi:hypothetical protein
MRRTSALGFAAGLLALAAIAAPIDRLVREDGTDRAVDAGDVDAGVTLVLGQGPTTRLRPSTCSAGVCTRVAPDAGTEGMVLSDIQSWWFEVCAPQADQTLVPNGTGCEFWRMNPWTQEWAWVPDKDKTVTKAVHCQGFPVVVNDMGGNGVRGLYRCNGVGVSGADGGWLKTTMAACKSRQAGGCAP